VLRWLQSGTLRCIDHFLSVSTAAQAFESRYFGIDSEVSPNMVDMAGFAAGKPREFMRGDKGTIVFLGRLVERKGAIYLLKALRIVHQQGKLQGVRVNICGDGDLRSELEDYVAHHQLGDAVMFHGFIDEAEKSDFLASADIAVFPATGGEAFGIVLIEAMATGQSVVLGGDNSGYRTVLGGRPELLFDPYDHEALAAKILHFLADKQSRQAAIDWQRNEVLQYDVNSVGQDMVRRYRAAIAQQTDTM